MYFFLTQLKALSVIVAVKGNRRLMDDLALRVLFVFGC